MRFSLAATAFIPVLSAAAADILVQVGAGGNLVFSPPNVTASIGDTVSFQFQNKNHSVTQSSFASPCDPLPSGVNSGFQPVASGATQLPQWSVTIDNATGPLWFYCAQTNPVSHCNKGMVFAINADPNSAKSFAAYQALAMNGAAAASAGGSVASAAAGVASAAASIAGGAASAAGGAIDGLTSAAGSVIGDATAAVASDAGAAATGIANGLTAAAGALTQSGDSSSPAPTSSAGNSTAPSAGFHVAASPVSLLAVVGLFAGLLL